MAHAVKDEQLFTHSGGLVAVHPVADADAALPEDYQAISYLVLGP